MKRQWIAMVLAVAVLTLITVSCRLPGNTNVDVVTGASVQYEPGKVVLPPKVGVYKVVGVVDGLKNFVVKYDNKIYRGGEPFKGSAGKSLKKLGVRTIISITPTDKERKFCKKNGFKLVEVPFDKKTGVSAENLNLYLKSIKTESAPFYVHCHGGTHRGGVLGVAYRVHINGWPYEKALVEHGRLGGDLVGDHLMLETVKKVRK